MTSRWALCLSPDEHALAAPLRLLAGIEICAQDGCTWLRGELSEALDHALARVPGGRRYRVLEDGQLIAHGQRIPEGQLPSGPWQTLASYLELALPTAQIPAVFKDQITLSLVPDDREREPNLLLTSLADWSSYALCAPQLRLACWHFALSETEQVLVRGLPLPPLPGQRYVAEQGIATPAGRYWSPPVEAAVLRALLQLDEHDIALLAQDGTWELIAGSDFVKATRSAVRHSQAGVIHG